MILANADAKSRTQNRDDINYQNILYPIYSSLLKALKLSPLFTVQKGNEITPHKLIESPYYGTGSTLGNTHNLMNDSLDALIIENMELRLNKNC